MHELDRLIRAATPELGSDQLDAATWDRIEAERGTRPAAAMTRTTSRSVARTLAIALAAAATLTGLAVAAEPHVRNWVFPRGSDADRMEAMTAPPASTGVALSPTDMETIRSLEAGSPVRIDGHRVLLDYHHGPVDATLHAFPTEAGDVCYLWVGSFGSGACGGAAFHDGVPAAITPGYFGREGKWATVTSITGLTTDEVEAVEVELRDGTVDSVIRGRNSFLWYPRPYVRVGPRQPGFPGTRTKPERSEPRAVVLHLTDGSTQRVDIPAE